MDSKSDVAFVRQAGLTPLTKKSLYICKFEIFTESILGYCERSSIAFY